jgi:hypothetical protein
MTAAIAPVPTMPNRRGAICRSFPGIFQDVSIRIPRDGIEPIL